MDPNSLATSTTNAPRKVRFKPKDPPANQKSVLLPKVEKVEADVVAAEKAELQRLLNVSTLNGYPKREKKVEPAKVAFGSSNHLNSLYRENEKPNHGAAGKEYKEPWDYHSCYPVTLPLRLPYSGDPELLDDQEFGVGSESQKYDENSINAAEQLGLTAEGEESGLFFLQLPSKLPMPVPKELPGQDTDVNGAASNKSSSSRNRVAFTLDDLPEGYMGKLVVYKSGAIKLKLGDNLYDVASGVDSTCAQDVASINYKNDKRCSVVGYLNKRAIITPDLDSMFDNKVNL